MFVLSIFLQPKIENMKTLATLTFALIFITSAVQAQDSYDDLHDMQLNVPSVAIVDLEAAAGTTIYLGPSAPVEAGQPLDFSAQVNTGLWLNYSSIKSTSQNPTRDIEVAITSGPLPTGVQLSVTASPYSGSGDGTMGVPTGPVNLSNAPQPLINGIGSCYTGDGVNNGHNLIYTLNLSGGPGAYATLDADASNTIQITYTISDN